MLGEVGARSQNSKYFSLNHLMLWDLKSEQTLFPLEAETRKNLKSIRLKITFPKIFHISVALLDSKKSTEVYERLDVNTWWCVMLPCDLPLKASRKGDCNASIAEYNSMSVGGCRRISNHYWILLLLQHICIPTGSMSPGWKDFLSYLVLLFFFLYVLFK